MQQANNRETIWVCPACGRTAESPYDFSDVSCAANAVSCYVDKLVFRYQSQLVESVKEGGVLDPHPKWPEYKKEEDAEQE